MEKPARRKVVVLKETSAWAESTIRSLAQVSANIIWTDHIEDQMENRAIDADAVLRILRTGYVDSPPTEANRPGEWKAKITKRLSSGRVAGVVTVIVKERRLILLTAEWEDKP
jgi:hypothetical protein